jgi:hypothetical protein
LRELISSFVNTLCKWYSTVRGLMNSCAPISGFELPSRASSAIWLVETGERKLHLRLHSNGLENPAAFRALCGVSK